jgi:fructokinase
MEKRWQTKAENLEPGHAAWELEAHYLGTACADFLCTLSPQKIVMGGGVMDVPGLIEKVRVAAARQLADYLRHPEIQVGLGAVIVPPGLGSRAGLCGALALAMGACG